MPTTKAERVSLLHHVVRREAFVEASRFRGEFYECHECLTVQGDELFEPTEALLCVEGPASRLWIRRWCPSTAVGTELRTEP
ncbi:hypothetical protein [Streptomyces sp. NPDC056544]|uniref:hypothetical protein n=1 Tax=unclassified Streptomyces TaxID=2593676 RepID=UPI0036C86041